MKHIFLIAENDLRMFLRDKAAYFWLFGSPLLFAFFMGFANRGPNDPANPRPLVKVENRDAGFLGALALEELEKGLRLQTNGGPEAQRVVRIPEDFTANILAKKQAKMELAHTVESQPGAASMVELKLLRTLIALNSHLVENAAQNPPRAPNIDSLREMARRPNPVELRASFGTRKPLPAGHQQSVPGVVVMFIMMNLLIFGGATVASERREGVLRRLLVQPLSRMHLILGKILGLLLLGAVQIIFLLVAARWLMKVQFAGNLPWVLLTMMVYAWAAAAFGILIGSIITREDKVVAVGVLVTMVMAALGGCWWPLEIVPENVRLLGHAFPTAWAMDALHQLISFGGGLADIRQELFILAGYAAAGTFAAARFFRA